MAPFSYKKHTPLALRNGLQAALLPTDASTLRGRLCVYAGALHEQPGEEGLAHLLEHMLIHGGTRKYSPEEADRRWESLGEKGASTSRSRTIFEAEMLPEDCEPFLNLLSEMAFSPRFDPRRVREQQAVVLQELADLKSNVAFAHNQAYLQALLGDSPQTSFVGGKEDVLRRATPDALAAFYARTYQASNMALLFVGALPPDLPALVERYFEGKPAGRSQRYAFPLITPLPVSTTLHVPAPEFRNKERPSVSSARLSLGMIVLPHLHADHFAFRVLAKELQSRLYEQVRQRQGLAYSPQVYYDGSDNAGVLQVDVGVPSLRQEEAIDAIFGELSSLQRAPLPPEALDRFTRQARYSFAQEDSTPEGQIYRLQTILDHGYTPERFFEQLHRLTPQCIRELACQYLPGGRADPNYVLMIRDPLKAGDPPMALTKPKRERSIR